MLPGFKRCSTCKLVKLRKEFGALTSAPDEKQSRCLVCQRAAAVAYRIAHPDMVAAAKKRHRKKHPEQNRNEQTRWRANNQIKCLLIRAKTRAKRVGVPFELTLHDIEIPKYCPVLGLPLHAHTGDGKRSFDDSPTIDRVIPALGYVPGNVAVISGRANRIKNDATLQELEQIVDWLKSNRRSP